jgi:hypothetical protein
MNKVFVITVLGLVLTSSCATNNYLKKTVWINVTPVEKDGVTGNILTSVYFWDKSTVSFYTAVEKDSAIIVEPYLSALGKYSCEGKIKKGVKFTVDMQTIDNENLSYKGILTLDGMVLVSPNSVAKGYNLVRNAIIKKR